MESVVVLNEQKFEEIIYRTFIRCLEEKNIGNLEVTPVEEGFDERSEVCGKLHISFPTLWRIEKAGLLEGVKVGRRKLYSKQDVSRLLESGMLANFNDKNK